MKKSGFRKPSYEEYRAKQALKASKPRKTLKKAKFKQLQERLKL